MNRFALRYVALYGVSALAAAFAVLAGGNVYADALAGALRALWSAKRET